MKSHEVLKQVIEEVGAKRVAADLKVSNSLVYKWCQEPSDDPADERSGTRNPLDRVVALLASTGDRRPIEWLCTQAGGFFVVPLEPRESEVDERYVDHTRSLLAEFSELLQVMSDSITHENRIDEAEAAEIRTQWQRLQGYGESFVRACEAGRFDPRHDRRSGGQKAGS